MTEGFRSLDMTEGFRSLDMTEGFRSGGWQWWRDEHFPYFLRDELPLSAATAQPCILIIAALA